MRHRAILDLILALAGLTAVGAPALAQDNAAFIEQVGNHNLATVTQGAGSSHGSARITQHGDGNDHAIGQDLGSGNEAEIAVTGDGNAGTIAQRGWDNRAGAAVTGDGNRFTVRQDGAAGPNLARIEQHGTGNTAAIDQTNFGPAGSGNTAFQVQHGGGNQASIAQAAFGSGGLAPGNAATQTQLGFGNTAGLTQDGRSNLALQTQTGHDNRMTATQTGGANVLFHAQIGNGLPDLQVTQTGGAIAVIVQSN